MNDELTKFAVQSEDMVADEPGYKIPPHRCWVYLAVEVENTRPPVEAQANIGAELMKCARSRKDAPSPQPTPPAAETREAGEWWVYIGQLYDTEQKARNEAIMDRCDPNEVFAVRKVTHPEPQAPRVSEEAMISLKTASESMHFFPRVDREICRELLAALSQPAQGECKTSDKNVEAVREKLAQRAAAGLNKYGVTTERGDLTPEEWLIHAQEEAMDLAVYLQRITAELAKGRGEG